MHVFFAAALMSVLPQSELNLLPSRSFNRSFTVELIQWSPEEVTAEKNLKKPVRVSNFSNAPSPNHSENPRSTENSQAATTDYFSLISRAIQTQFQKDLSHLAGQSLELMITINRNGELIDAQLIHQKPNRFDIRGTVLSSLRRIPRFQPFGSWSGKNQLSFKLPVVIE